MSPPEVFTFGELLTHTDLNAHIQDLPRNCVYHPWTDQGGSVNAWSAQGSSYPANPDIQVDFQPVMGAYLAASWYMITGGGGTDVITTKAVIADGLGGFDQLWEISATGTLQQKKVLSPSLTTLTNCGNLVGSPASLLIFLKDTPGAGGFFYSLVLQGGNSGTAADYGY